MMKEYPGFHALRRMLTEEVARREKRRARRASWNDGARSDACLFRVLRGLIADAEGFDATKTLMLDVREQELLALLRPYGVQAARCVIVLELTPVAMNVTRALLNMVCEDLSRSPQHMRDEIQRSKDQQGGPVPINARGAPSEDASGTPGQQSEGTGRESEASGEAGTQQASDGDGQCGDSGAGSSQQSDIEFSVFALRALTRLQHGEDGQKGLVSLRDLDAIVRRVAREDERRRSEKLSLARTTTLNANEVKKLLTKVVYSVAGRDYRDHRTLANVRLDPDRIWVDEDTRRERPVCLHLVLDASGSMRDEQKCRHLHDATQAVLNAVAALTRGGERVPPWTHAVVFDHAVMCETKPQPGIFPSQKDRVLTKVACPRGCTRPSVALNLVMTALRRLPAMRHCVLVVTDGACDGDDLPRTDRMIERMETLACLCGDVSSFRDTGTGGGRWYCTPQRSSSRCSRRWDTSPTGCEMEGRAGGRGTSCRLRTHSPAWLSGSPQVHVCLFSPAVADHRGSARDEFHHLCPAMVFKSVVKSVPVPRDAF